MSVPIGDRALHHDTRSVLSEMKGPVAANYIEHGRVMLAAGERRSPNYSRIVSADSEDFVAQCDAGVEEFRGKLVELAPRVPSNAPLQIALLLGQADFRKNTVSPGPNAYASEIELLSPFMTCPPDATTPEDGLVGALQLLAYARRIGILESLRRSSGPDDEISTAFATTGAFRRGRFYGAYDQMVMHRLFDRLRSAGLNPQDPTVFRHFTEKFVSTWVHVMAGINRTARSSVALSRFLASGALLGEAASSLARDSEALAALSTLGAKLWVPRSDLVQAVPGHLQGDARGWLDRLAFELSSGLDLKAVTRTPLAYTGERMLLVSPHRLDTDVTDLVDKHWSADFGEKYYRHRGGLVEEIANETLGSLPGARGIESGVYKSIDGRTQGECDGIVIVDRILFVIEAKGGFISGAARHGSSEATRSDVQRTVSEAYFQAARLIDVLTRDQQVTLRSQAGSFQLRRTEIDRVHVIIPTADDMAAVATRLEALAAEGYLPESSSPAILAAQDLLLIRDLLPTKLERLAYFEFREQVLRARPRIVMADEAELLGGFVSGVDFVAHVEALDDAKEFGAIMPDMTLQKHLEGWLYEKFENGRDVRPPRRHVPAVHSIIERLAATDLVGAIDALQASRQAGVAGCAMQSQTGMTVSISGEISVVSVRGGLRRGDLGRNREARRARRTWQNWVTSTSPRTGEVAIQLVERTPRNARSGYDLASCPDEASLWDWYRKYESKRRKPVDVAAVRALEDTGISPTAATGAVRKGFAPLIHASAEAGADAKKIAAFCLDVLAPVVSAEALDPSCLAPLAPSIVELQRLLESEVLLKSELCGVVQKLLIEGSLPSWLLGRLSDESQGASIPIEVAVRSAIVSNPDVWARVKANDLKAIRFLAGQALKLIPRARPTFETAQMEVERLCDECCLG